MAKSIPNALCDGLIYGSITYWFVGLAYNDGASVANYFIYLFLLFYISLSAGLLFSIFSSVVRDRTLAQAAMAVSSKSWVLEGAVVYRVFNRSRTIFLIEVVMLVLFRYVTVLERTRCLLFGRLSFLGSPSSCLQWIYGSA